MTTNLLCITKSLHFISHFVSDKSLEEREHCKKFGVIHYFTVHVFTVTNFQLKVKSMTSVRIAWNHEDKTTEIEFIKTLRLG